MAALRPVIVMSSAGKAVRKRFSENRFSREKRASEQALRLCMSLYEDCAVMSVRSRCVHFSEDGPRGGQRGRPTQLDSDTVSEQDV